MDIPKKITAPAHLTLTEATRLLSPVGFSFSSGKSKQKQRSNKQTRNTKPRFSFFFSFPPYPFSQQPNRKKGKNRNKEPSPKKKAKKKKREKEKKEREEKRNLLNVISGDVAGVIGCHHGLHLHQVLLHFSLSISLYMYHFLTLAFSTHT